MVQKDEVVSLLFYLKYPDNEKKYDIKSVKDVSKVKDTILSTISNKNENKTNEHYTIEHCVLKIHPFDKEIDLLPFIKTDELQEKLEEKLKNSDDCQVLEINVSYNLRTTPLCEDKALVELYIKCPHSDGERINNSANIVFPEKVDSTELETLIQNDKTKFSVDKSEHTEYVGLVNQAMTCYLNSLLQALFMTPEFRNGLYNWDYRKVVKDSEASIPFQLQKLFLNLQTSEKPAVETTSLTKSFGWNPTDSWHQHDIQELCRVMFEALEQSFKNTDQADLINQLYAGKINDYVKCLTCNTEKFRDDTFLDIALPVRPFDNTTAYGSVEEALEAFVKYETLEGNNQYFCEKCDKKSDAHKGLKFTKFPYILTLQLKRFDFDQNTYHRIKLNDKVTFPDILNLNSFIETTPNKESPSREEDPGLSVKCDDSLTTLSSTMDDEGALSYEAIASPIASLNSNHLTNHDQDDDEGIDMNNGMSTSSCSTHDNMEKLREQYKEAKGPYIYELFSIMIHSGSANGGHYYAYIKDFRNNKWLCFNDQNVTFINQEDIQKTYGGGNKGTIYSAYRSSTNAYMLMYRQIDPERNALPMKTEDFPDHIKDLLENMKKEDDQTSQRVCPVCIASMYYKNPKNGNLEQTILHGPRNSSLACLTLFAYNKVGLEDYSISLDQCRLVKYLSQYDLIDQTFDGLEDRPFYHLDPKTEFYLDVRGKTDTFESYPSETIVTQVYLLDTEKQSLIDGPKKIRAYKDETGQEYKNEIIKQFNLDPDTEYLFCRNLQTVSQNQFIFDEDILKNDLHSHVSRIGVSDTEDKSALSALSDCLHELLTFYIYTSDFETADDCVEGRFNEDEEIYTTEKLGKFTLNYLPEKEEWNVQETSNSEDSSLSDSDRTLVGDVPDEADYTLPDKFSFNNYYKINRVFKTNHDSIGGVLKRSESEEDFTQVNDHQRTELQYQVTIHNSIKEDQFKMILEKHFKIPKETIIINQYVRDELSSRKGFREGHKYYVRKKNVDYNDVVDIYILDMLAREPILKIKSKSFKSKFKFGALKQSCFSYIEENRKDPDDYIIMEYRDNTLFSIDLDDDSIVPASLKGLCLVKTSKEPVVYTRFVYHKTKCLEDESEKIHVNPEGSIRYSILMQLSLNSNISSKRFCPVVVRDDLIHKYSGKDFDALEWKSDIQYNEIDPNITYILILDQERDNDWSFRNREHTTKLRSTPMTINSRKEKALKINFDT